MSWLYSTGQPPATVDRLRDLALEAQARAATERNQRPGRQMNVYELLKEEEENGQLMEVLLWNRDYDVRADARKAAWQASPFFGSFTYMMTPVHLR